IGWDRMRLTVCELADETKRRGHAWAELTRHLDASPTDILVLPEMPFVEWTAFTSRTFDPKVWQQALIDHDAMVSRFSELRAEVVLASRPVEDAGRRLNQGFAWTRANGYQSSRSKVYLPDGPDGWEATWSLLADRLVLTLINRQQVKPDQFEKQEGGAIRLTEASRRALLSGYQQRKREEVMHP